MLPVNENGVNFPIGTDLKSSEFISQRIMNERIKSSSKTGTIRKEPPILKNISSSETALLIRNGVYSAGGGWNILKGIYSVKAIHNINPSMPAAKAKNEKPNSTSEYVLNQ